MPKAVTKDRSIKVSERTLQAAKRLKARVAKHGWAILGVDRTGPASIADVVEIALKRLESINGNASQPGNAGLGNADPIGLHSMVENNRDDSQT